MSFNNQTLPAQRSPRPVCRAPWPPWCRLFSEVPQNSSGRRRRAGSTLERNFTRRLCFGFAAFYSGARKQRGLNANARHIFRILIGKNLQKRPFIFLLVVHIKSTENMSKCKCVLGGMNTSVRQSKPNPWSEDGVWTRVTMADKSRQISLK